MVPAIVIVPALKEAVDTHSWSYAETQWTVTVAPTGLKSVASHGIVEAHFMECLRGSLSGISRSDRSALPHPINKREIAKSSFILLFYIGVLGVKLNKC